MNEKADLGGKQDGVGTGIQRTEPPETAGASMLENEPIEVLEARSIGALLLIEQYTSLRSEIEKRIDIRQQILALTLIVAGTFLTVGVQPNVPAAVLLFYPLIALFLGAIWEHNDLRVGQINFYLRSEMEKHLGALGPGWETFRARTFPSRRRTPDLHKAEQRNPLTPRIGLIVFATRGMFFTTQAMAIIVAAVRYASELLQQPYTGYTTGRIVISAAVSALFLVDIAILIYTYSVVQHKRA